MSGIEPTSPLVLQYVSDRNTAPPSGLVHLNFPTVIVPDPSTGHHATTVPFGNPLENSEAPAGLEFEIGDRPLLSGPRTEFSYTIGSKRHMTPADRFALSADGDPSAEEARFTFAQAAWPKHYARALRQRERIFLAHLFNTSVYGSAIPITGTSGGSADLNDFVNTVNPWKAIFDALVARKMYELRRSVDGLTLDMVLSEKAAMLVSRYPELVQNAIMAAAPSVPFTNVNRQNGSLIGQDAVANALKVAFNLDNVYVAGDSYKTAARGVSGGPSNPVDAFAVITLTDRSAGTYDLTNGAGRAIAPIIGPMNVTTRPWATPRLRSEVNETELVELLWAEHRYNVFNPSAESGAAWLPSGYERGILFNALGL